MQQLNVSSLWLSEAELPRLSVEQCKVYTTRHEARLDVPQLQIV